MVTDAQLFMLRNTDYAHHTSDKIAHTQMSADLGLNADSIRARINRSITPDLRLSLMQEIALNPPKLPTAVKRQRAQFARAELAFADKREALFWEDQTLIGAGDKHFPKTRFDTLALELQIIADLQPDWLTAGNDFSDNEGFGRWADNRQAFEKTFTQDITNTRTGETQYILSVREASPNTTPLFVGGNHDMWLFNHQRERDPQNSEKSIADYLEELERLGVLVFSSTRENSIEFDQFVVVHGVAAAESPINNGKRAIKQFMYEGRAKWVLQFHTHREALLYGASLGYPGAGFINAPCMCHTEEVSYLKHDPRSWGLGISIIHFNESNGLFEPSIVSFVPRGRSLTAQYNGVRYETELKDQPYNDRFNRSAS